MFKAFKEKRSVQIGLGVFMSVKVWVKALYLVSKGVSPNIVYDTCTAPPLCKCLQYICDIVLNNSLDMHHFTNTRFVTAPQCANIRGYHTYICAVLRLSANVCTILRVCWVLRTHAKKMLRYPVYAALHSLHLCTNPRCAAFVQHKAHTFLSGLLKQRCVWPHVLKHKCAPYICIGCVWCR